LADVPVIITKANQAIQALERYKARLDEVMGNLNGLEFEDLVTLMDVATVLQRAEMTHRVALEIEHYVTELGTEGRLINMQMEELLANVESDTLLVIRDYMRNRRRPERIRNDLASLSAEHLLDPHEVFSVLGYSGDEFRALDKATHPRGYRLLSKVPRLPMSIINKIIGNFCNLQNVLDAEIEELNQISGIGKVRARAIKDGLKRLKEHSLLERFM
jgi:diadenylate cyclase